MQLWEAQITYSCGNKKRLLHCWLKVRNSPKFHSINPEKKISNNAKKQKTSNATPFNPVLVYEDKLEEGIGSPQTPNTS